MGYYRKKKRYYKNNYDDFEIDVEGIISLVILGAVFSIINFIMKNYKTIILVITLIAWITVLIIVTIYIIKRIKPWKEKNIEKKLKTTELYKNIQLLNSKYNIEPLGIYYDNYHVYYKSNLKTCNIDDYLLMTINKEYDKLREYKIKYNELNNKYKQYEIEYEELKKNINIEEAKKLKLKQDKYMDNQLKLYNDYKQKPDIDFKVVIYINYKSPKGKVQDKVYKKYNKEQFLKIMDEYKKLKNQDRLLEISSRIERAKMSESMRYDILKRDNYKCQICGMTAKEGAKLQVDHIIPVSKGGKTEMSNLQTLCSRCNIGKSNKL